MVRGGTTLLVSPNESFTETKKAQSSPTSITNNENRYIPGEHVMTGRRPVVIHSRSVRRKFDKITKRKPKKKSTKLYRTKTNNTS